MRDSIKRLKPKIQVSKSGEHYASVDLGKLSLVEGGGYKLEGPIFPTSNINRRGMHAAIEQLMDRLDQALDESAV
jgi:hypothetical protein